MPHASYAVDIGMYNVGDKGQIRSDATTAWARSVEGSSSLDGFVYKSSGSLGVCDAGTLRDAAGSGSDVECGRSIAVLADRIAKDIKEGFTISLGMEAPMWFPVWREQHPRLKLFRPRFCCEKRNGWYLQSGASATLKAISIASMLLDLLTSSQPQLKLSTDPKSSNDKTIVLYEAFVAGEFKVAAPDKVKKANNEWDAFIASLAWGACNSGFVTPPSLSHKKLHEAGSAGASSSPRPEIASVWNFAASLVRSNPLVNGPPDCQIVALAKAGSDRVRNSSALI